MLKPSNSVPDLLDQSPEDDKIREMLNFIKPSSSEPMPTDISYKITTTPGFVIKTLNASEKVTYPLGMKVFINVCHSIDIPPAPLITDEELQKAIQSEDPSQYKIPLSLAGPRSDIDKLNRTCIVFDSCINSITFKKTLDINFFGFLIELVLQWVEQKHSLVLSREYSIPRMKNKGNLQVHCIKRIKQPVISPIEETIPVSTQPKYTIQDNQSQIIVFVELPLIDKLSDIQVDLESQSIFLKSSLYDLNIPLSCPIDIQSSKAEFRWLDKRLTIHLNRQ